MKSFTNKQNIKQNYFSLIISLVPISFIAGNTIININIVLLIISGLIIFHKDLFKINLFFLDKLLISYFLLIVLVGIYNDFSLYHNYNYLSEHREVYFTSLKSFLFLRFLLLYLLIRILIEKKILNLKPFFYISTLCVLFVSIDINFQLITGKDFFGYEVDERFRKLAGPFDSEYIAGGYIQRFSLFSIFIFPILFLKLSKKIYYCLIFILFLIIFTGIIFSGNRMPLIMFFLSLSTLLFFEIKSKKKLLIFFLIASAIFFLSLSFNQKAQNNFKSFYFKSGHLIKSMVYKNTNNLNVPYKDEFESGYFTWKVNKFFGGGIKNFNFYCHRSKEEFKKSYFCNNHPHNYYLENLSELGIIGFFGLTIIVTIIFYITIIKKYFLKSNLQNNIIVTPFIFLFFAELFPLRSTGSFFTTGNATYIFFIMAFLVSLTMKDNLIEKNSQK